MLTRIKSGKILFLYDYSMFKFIKQAPYSDIFVTVKKLINASRCFLWFYSHVENSGMLLGMNLIFENKKFRLFLLFQNNTVEYKANWIDPLGKTLLKFYDFKKPLHVTYDEVIMGNQFTKRIIDEAIAKENKV